MSLIKCKNCENEVSEKAKFCPSCGVDLTTTETIENDVDEIKCEDCGTTLQKDEVVCTHCGCPVETNETQVTNAEPHPQTFEPIVDVAKPKSAKMFVLIGVIAVFLIFAAVATYVSVSKAKHEALVERYIEDVKISTDTMYTSAQEVEEITDLTSAVWLNSIKKERSDETDKYTLNLSGTFNSDFNTSLDKLSSDSEISSIINSIKVTRAQSTATVKTLKDYPKECEELFDVYKTYYDSYIKLSEFAVNAEGSYLSYTEESDKAIDEFIEAYRDLELEF